MSKKTKKRKSDHLRICLEENVEAKKITTGMEEVFFVHKALPEINRDDIDLSSEIFDHKFSAPIIVEAMTGGTPESVDINKSIAEAVERLNLGMGVGSQRVAIENSDLEATFSISRKAAPTAFLLANIGSPQIVGGYGIMEARKAVKMIDADALTIHLNPLQEVIQPEGEPKYRNLLEKIGFITRELEVPVIAKETGAGIAKEEAKKLEGVGVKGIDISGAGGTSWAAVEYYRAIEAKDEFRQRLGEIFWDWGIPTAASLVEVTKSTNLRIIASGGIRSGIDIAKALALGADSVGFALPILSHAKKGSLEVEKKLQSMLEELRNTLFLTGATSIEELKRKPIVITGKTAEWLRTRGFQIGEYARRK